MLELSGWIVREMHQRCKVAYPSEGTGAVLYRPGRPGELFDAHWEVVGIHNAAKEPRQNYAWSERQTRLLFEKMERTETEIKIIFHSHPETHPEPSEVDTMAAWYIGVHYVIFSLAGGPEDLWFKSYLCVAPGVLEPEETVVL